MWIILAAGAWGIAGAFVGFVGTVIAVAIGEFDSAAMWARVGAWGLIVGTVCFSTAAFAMAFDR
jgi:hypothetical protein